jgi:hypothetical protein
VFKVSVLILCAALMTFHTLCVEAADRDVGWNLAPGQCGALESGADSTVMAAQINAGTSAKGASVWIGVTEEANRKRQWLTTFAKLHVGDEFVVGGEIYEISSIKVIPVHAAPYTGNLTDPGAGCVPGASYVTVQDKKHDVFVGDQVGMILPADTIATLRVGGDACVMAVSFSPEEDTKSVARLEWREESLEPWKACDKWKGDSGSFGINDVLDMHEYGRFRIKMIIPRTINHPDWMVLVKDGQDRQDRGGDRGHP